MDVNEVEVCRTDYVVGCNLNQQTACYLKKRFPQSDYNLLLVSNTTVYKLYGQRLETDLRELGYGIYSFLVGDGEEFKTIASVQSVIDFCLERALSRQTVILALGGGMVGDLAGFVASIYLRGVPYIQLPTTLLAQVDSSIGGKVGVNHSLAKNALGSFYHPHGVFADITALKTLPEREFKSGLAEVIKYGFIQDRSFVDFLRAKRKEILSRNTTVLSSIVEYCVGVKKQIVVEDERDLGKRRILNFGHTVGHALERLDGYKGLTHGEAVSLGMVVAARLSVCKGFLRPIDGEFIVDTLAEFGLPTHLENIFWDEVVQGLVRDKKGTNSNINFILASAIGQVVVVPNVELEMVKEAAFSLLRG